MLWAGIYLSSGLDAIIAKSEDAGRTWGKADGGTGLGGMVASFWEEITCSRYALLVSHDDGAAWKALPLDGLPQAPEQ